MRVVIIDDEQMAIENLKIQLSGLEEKIDIIGEANSVKSGFDLMEKIKPELVFLDIEMNDGTGFDLLKKFNNIDFNVIFSTAYDQYAIQAIKFSALDYLLKPIDPVELGASIKKAIDQKKLGNESGRIENFLKNMETGTTQEKKLAVRDTTSIKYVGLDEISHLSADGSYTNVVLTSGVKLLSAKVLKFYDELLNDYQFFRIHRSNMVNLNHVKEYEYKHGGSVIMKNGDQLYVSDEKKKDLLNRLEE